jgi:hypothetical protein
MVVLICIAVFGMLGRISLVSALLSFSYLLAIRPNDCPARLLSLGWKVSSAISFFTTCWNSFTVLIFCDLL